MTDLANEQQPVPAPEKPNLTGIDGGLSGPKEVKPTTGLPEGQAGVVSENNQSLLARVRSALSKIISKADTNKDNTPPHNKAF